MNDDIFFAFPTVVAVDSSGNVYVCDQRLPGHLRNIQKFDSEGTFITSWDSEGFAQGVDVGPSGNVYVTDATNARVQKFDSEGTFIIQWTSEGCARVAVGSSGNVYVTDHVNVGVQKFDSEGTFIKSWGRSENQNGQFSFPQGVAVGSSENVYVSDGLDHSRIQKFDSEGTFITTWGSGP